MPTISLLHQWSQQLLLPTGLNHRLPGLFEVVKILFDVFNVRLKILGLEHVMADKLGQIANRLEAYEAVGRSGLPVLALWGTADTVVPFGHSEELLRRAPQAKLVPVEAAPHGLPLLQPEAMIAIVLPFLNAQSAPGAR